MMIQNGNVTDKMQRSDNHELFFFCFFLGGGGRGIKRQTEFNASLMRSPKVSFIYADHWFLFFV